MDNFFPASFEAMDSMGDDELFTLIRNQLLIPPNRIYLNTGSLGPSPVKILDLVHATMRTLEMNPVVENWGTLGKQMEAVRELVAEFVNADKEHILLTRNTTEGLNVVAQSLKLQPGDEILTTDQEHGGAMVGLDYVANNQGAVIRKMSMPMPSKSEEEIVHTVKSNITERTKVLLLSHVNTITGLVMPFEAIARITKPKGIILIADGAQALGQIPVDVKAMGVDAYACSGHKWLMGPKETGLLYVAPDFKPQINTAFTYSGFGSYSASSGTRNVATLIGLGAVIQWHQEIGKDRVHKRCLEIRNYCYDHLARLKGLHIISPEADMLSCGIVSFTLEEAKNSEIAHKLKDQDIIIKTLPGINGNRISCHMFTSKKDIDDFIQALGKAI
ncbi:MAG: aminotransferase class V-fold PLP-dependent enzyme [Muricauda sp.]|nr:aminotransferase class V-fold PLP-dependent enzyme [Allomuricauda sp.]